MSAAKKCDRCGKFYEKNISYKGIAWCTNGIIAGIKTTTINDHSDYKYDLCDECVGKLYMFLNNEIGNEVKQEKKRSCETCKVDKSDTKNHYKCLECETKVGYPNWEAQNAKIS